jgi:hypothetical protein
VGLESAHSSKSGIWNPGWMLMLRLSWSLDQPRLLSREPGLFVSQTQETWLDYSTLRASQNFFEKLASKIPLALAR